MALPLSVMRSRARLADSKVHKPEECSMVAVEDSKTFVLRSMRKQLREGDNAHARKTTAGPCARASHFSVKFPKLRGPFLGVPI